MSRAADGHTRQADRPADPAPQDGAAMAVLRGIWGGQQQGSEQLRAELERTGGTAKVCKNMKHIGFGGITEGGGDAESTAVPVGEEMRSAWRATLEREGKLPPGSSSVRELVFGQAESEH